LGGHCIPIDPFYLTWKAREFGKHTRFIELAGEINTAMPDYVISKVADALNDEGKAIKGSKILILGLAYKANVDDCRESPSFVLMEKLEAKGATVEYNDSFVPVVPPTREHAHFTGKQSVEIEDAYDLILVSTDHAEYKTLISVVMPAHLSIPETAFSKNQKIFQSMSKKYLVTGARGLLPRKSVSNYLIRVTES
jgi:UDP-N-acetyl-D-glucosamine dehydrogenase